jgi:hypothetical protein
MDTHINILSAETSLCMCEVEKTISDFLGILIKFEADGDLYIYSNDKKDKKVEKNDFDAFLLQAKSLQSAKQ